MELWQPCLATGGDFSQPRFGGVLVMDVSRQPGDLLAQPTRARLFALLGELRRPASTDELAQRLDLHPNGVRTHLERLHEVGLVERGRERPARGRPRDAWSISADAHPGGDPPTAYADLSRWLVRAIVAGRIRVRDVEAVGRRIGRDLAAPGDAGSPEQVMHSTLAAMGFRPRRELAPGDKLTYCLDNCPYRDAVRERQPIVCGLHRGLTRGLLDAIDPKTKLAGFVPKDPDAAGCLIQLRGPLAREAAARKGTEGSSR
ncbi:MAG: helix-turn-helix domain-containing protein [Solirubrobacterales bacterium]|nr:helix-turn-helix domain-containing protein [Solirubrobacterales bacterium]